MTAAALVILLIGPAKTGWANNCVSNAASGNWSNATSWTGCGGLTPQPPDTATIASSNTITVDASPTVKQVTINADASLQADLNNRTLTLNPDTPQTAFTVNNSTGFLAGNSTVVINSTSSIAVNIGTITFNNLSFTPTVTASNTYTFGSSSITCLGTFNINPTKATAGINTLQINLGAPMAVASTTTVQATTNARSTFTTTNNNYALTSGQLNIVTNGTFIANASSITLNGTSGILFSQTGSFNQNTSTVTMIPDASVTLTSNNGITFNHLVLAPTLSADRTYTLGASSLTFTGDLRINPSKPSAGNNTLTVKLGSATSVGVNNTTLITGSGNGLSNLDTTISSYPLTTGSLNIQGNGTFTANGSTITIYGATAPLFTNAGTFSQGTSTVTFTPDATINPLTSGAITFNHLNIAPTLTASRAYTLGSSPLTVDGNFTINPTGAASRTLTVSMGAAITCLGTTTITGTTNGRSTLDTSGSNYAFTTGHLNIVNNSTFTANGSSVTLNASSGPLFTRTGFFSQGTSTVTLAPSASTTINTGSMTVNHLFIDSPGFTQTAGSTITVLGNWTINNGAFDDGGYQSSGTAAGLLKMAAGTNLSLGSTVRATLFPGNFTNANISLNSASTVTYNAGAAQNISAIPTYGNLAINSLAGSPAKKALGPLVANGYFSNVNGNFTTQSWSLTVASSFTQSGGEVSIGTSVVTVQGDFTKTGGGFGAGTSTVTFTGSGNQTLTSNATGFYHVVVNKPSGSLLLAGAMYLTRNLTLSNGILDTDINNNYPITVSSDVIFNGGNLQLNTASATVQGNWKVTSGSFTATGSTVAFTGGSAQSLTSGGTDFFHLIVNKPAGTLTLVDTLNIDGNFTESAGTINTSSQAINITGNWARTAGTFTGTGSTVTFDNPSISYLSGATTFYALKALTAGSTLQFTAGTTQYVTSFLDLENVSLRSSANNSTWYFTYTGSSQTLLGVAVQDSNALGGSTLFPDNQSTDSGNNHNWSFGGNNKRYWIQAGASNWNTTASWAYTSNGNSGAPVPTAASDVIFDGGDGTKNGAATIDVAVNIATLSISGTTGVVNTTGWAVTLSSSFIQSSGSLFLSSAVFTIQGDFNKTGGGFGAGTSTVTFTGSGNQTLTSNATSFYHVVVNKPAGSLLLAGALYLTRNLTLSSGILDTDVNNNYPVTVSSDVIFNGGNLVVNTASATVQGNWKVTSGSFTATGSTVAFTGSSAQSLTSGGTDFFNLAVNKTAGTLTLVDTLNIDGNFTESAGTINTSSQAINITGNWARTAGTFTGTGSTVTFDNPSISYLSGATTFYALKALTSGSTLQFTAGTTQYVTSFLDLENVSLRSTSNNSTWYFTYTGSSQTLLGVTVQDSNALGGSTLFPDNQSTDSGNNRNWSFGGSHKRYWIQAGASNWNTTASWAYTSNGNSGAPVPAASDNVFFDGGDGTKNGAATIDVAVNIATLSISGTTGAVNTTGWAITLSSSFLQSSGSLSLSSAVFTIQGDFNKTGGGFGAGTSTVTFTGSGNQTLTSNATSFYHVVVNKPSGSLLLAGALYLTRNLTLTSGILDTDVNNNYPITVSSDTIFNGGNLNLHTSSITVQGNWNVISGSFTATGSTVAFTGSSAQSLTSGGTNFYNLIVNKPAGTLSLVDTLNIKGSFTESAGTINTSNQAINITGNWARTAGTFTGTGSTVTFNGSSVSNLSGATTFYALKALTSGSTLQFTAGTTQYVTSFLDLENVSLRSTSNNSTWYFTYTGSSQTLINVDVRDSNASGGSVIDPDILSHDSGNNHNWDFGGPTTVLDLSASAPTATTVQLTWSAPTDIYDNPLVGSYAIQYSTWVGATLSQANAQITISTSSVSPGAAQSYVVTGLTPNTSQYFYLWSADERPNWSSISNGTTVATLSNIISNPATVSVFNTSATLTWTALPATPSSSSAAGYALEASSTNFNGFGITQTSVTYVIGDSTLTVFNLLGNTTYFFRVGSINIANTTNYAQGPSTATLAQTVTNVVTNNVYFSSITFGWTAVPNLPSTSTAENYLLELSTMSDFSLDWISSTTGNISLNAWSPSNLYGGDTYYFRVGSLNWNNMSNYSAVVSTLVPVQLNVLLSTNSIQLGSLTAGTTVVITSSITFTNTSNVTCRFQLSIDSPAVWVPTSGAAGTDLFRLTGVFKNSQPASTDFDVTNDVIMPSTATASDTNFAFDSGPQSEKGVNVSSNSARGLWFRIEMPPISSTTNEQIIRLHATASQ